jgi:hypothetical protein
MLALCLPALLSWSAGDFSDLKPYVAGGHGILEWLGTKLDSGPVAVAHVEGASGSEGAAQETAEPAQAQVSGLRSVTFSLLTYLAAIIDSRFAPLVLLQAAAALWLLMTFFRTIGASPLPAALLTAALLPPVALGVSRASPDIWAGLMVLALLVLLEGFVRLRLYEKILAALVVAAAVSFHASHLPLAAATLGAYVFIAVFRRTELLKRKWGVGLAGLAVVLGTGASMLAGFIGFGEVSVTPKRYPIALARSIEDGPALWHLEEHCPTYQYTVCQIYPGGIPTNVGAFLWSENGVANVATPEQMDALREEEIIILQRAASEYPFAAVRRAAGNALTQLVSFDVNTGSFARRRPYEGDGQLEEPVKLRAWWLTPYHVVLNRLHMLTMLLAVAALIWTISRPQRLASSTIRLLVVTTAALLTNAAICGVLSAPVDRYQVRVVWLLPVLLIGIHWQLIEHRASMSRAALRHRLSPGSAR